MGYSGFRQSAFLLGEKLKCAVAACVLEYSSMKAHFAHMRLEAISTEIIGQPQSQGFQNGLLDPLDRVKT